MYNLSYYKEKNPRVIEEFIAQYPFAFLSGYAPDDYTVMTQVPVFIENINGKKVLRGHIMKNTDHHKAFLQNEKVGVIFTGRHTYVSATWYSNPHTASTWNYMSVHIKGKIRFLDGAGLIDIRRKTTLYFEKDNAESTTIYDNLSPSYVDRLRRMIVGFEIEILEMDNIFKLSQDRDYESYQNIIRKLQEQDFDGKVVATEMEKRTKEVFPEKDNVKT